MLTIGILSILSAIILSIVSAVFSITGLQTIFSGAVLGITIMGASMELAKVSATLWLYSSWKKSKKLLKTYFIIAITILIVISTLGIFGYLSKAYVGQESVITQYDNKIERFEKNIELKQRKIKRANKDIELLNDALQSYIDIDVITRALDKREEQEEERNKLHNIINEAESNIAEYEDKIYELKNEKEKFQVNVGPVKYMAILLYGEEDAEDFYDNAARIFIILLCIVFDPFAVLLMVSGNISIDSYRRRKKQKNKVKKNDKKEVIIDDKKEDLIDLPTEIHIDNNIKEKADNKNNNNIDYEYENIKDYEGNIPEKIHKKRNVRKRPSKR